MRIRYLLGALVFIALALMVLSKAVVQDSHAAPAKKVGNTVSWPPAPSHHVAGGNTPRIASYQSTIYVIFEDLQKIYLTSSNDGLSWSAPRLVSGTDAAADPRIVILSDGTRVITWKKLSGTSGPYADLRYYREDSCGNVGPVTIYSPIVTDYDIAAIDDHIHVVVGDSSQIYYGSFAATSPPSSSSNPFSAVFLQSICWGNTQPNAPVIAGRKTNSGTEVAILFYLYTNEQQTGCAVPPAAAEVWLIALGTANSGPIFTAPITSQSATTSKSPLSISLDGDGNGTYYWAASFKVNGSGYEVLGRGTLGTMKVKALPAGAQPRRLSVAVRRNQSSYFNLASLEYQQMFPQALRRIGSWPSFSPAPTFGNPQTLLSTFAVDARATSIQVCSGSKACAIDSIFVKLGGSGGINVDTYCAASPACTAISSSANQTGSSCQ